MSARPVSASPCRTSAEPLSWRPERHQVPLAEAAADLEHALGSVRSQSRIAGGQRKPRAHPFQVALLGTILFLGEQALGAGQPCALEAGALELVVARQAKRAQRGGSLLSPLEPGRVGAGPRLDRLVHLPGPPRGVCQPVEILGVESLRAVELGQELVRPKPVLVCQRCARLLQPVGGHCHASIVA